MQAKRPRISNEERSQAMRRALLDAGRALFVAKSYTETSTPDIVAAAGVTRGALYHHFEDKKALFQAVVETEAEAVARSIDEVGDGELTAIDALIKGGEAFVTAMTEPGRTRLLLLDGPAVLGPAAMRAIDERHARKALREGIEAAIAAGALPALPAGALTAQLSAAFDAAALGIEMGDAIADHRAALHGLIEGLAASAAER
jgi:AcrR family transcriptional regulator